MRALHPGQGRSAGDSGDVANVNAARFFTVGQLARRWSISPRSIGRMITAGQLPAVKLGPDRGALRIPVESVERVEHERSTESCAS